MTCVCVTSDQSTSVLNARWDRSVHALPPPTPLEVSLRPASCGPFAFMAQRYICIDCGRTVAEVVRGRCDHCRPSADKERHAKYGHGTGRMTPARREHQAFITSSAWRKLRKQVLIRDGHQCTRCGSTKSLTVHHIIPVRTDPSLALEMDNCITLCRSCHGRAEGGRG